MRHLQGDRAEKRDKTQINSFKREEQFETVPFAFDEQAEIAKNSTCESKDARDKIWTTCGGFAVYNALDGSVDHCNAQCCGVGAS